MEKEINVKLTVMSVLQDQGFIENVDNIDSNQNLKNDLGMDSLDIIEFIMDVEKKTDVDLTNNIDEIESGTIQTTINAVTKKLNN